MEIDQAKEEEQDEVPGATPDPSDDETDKEDNVAPQLPGILRSSSAKATKESEGGPPPKRELPFGQQTIRTKQPEKQLPSAADEDDDEDAEDEEL
jgi:hypothetical protein